VWQAKNLRKGDFGSVAIVGLTGEILDLWQIKELEERGSGKLWDRKLAGYGALRRRWWVIIKRDITTPVQYLARWIFKWMKGKELGGRKVES